MRAIIRDLGATDPGLLLAIGILIGGAIVIVFYQLCAVYDLRVEQRRQVIEEVPALHPDLSPEQVELIERLREPRTTELHSRLKKSEQVR